MALSSVGTGRRAPLDLLRSLVEFRSDGPKVSVEKIIAALEKANLVEARHLEKVFSTGVDKVVAVILETPMGAEGATVTVVEDFVRHSPRLAELEAKLRDTTSGALGDNLAHVDADTRKRYAPQQGSEDGTTTATSESLCWARALKKSRWATSGGAGSLQDEEEKLRTKWVSRAVGILRTAGVPAVAGAIGFRSSGASTVVINGKGKTRDDPDESEGMGGHVKMA